MRAAGIAIVLGLAVPPLAGLGALAAGCGGNDAESDPAATPDRVDGAPDHDGAASDASGDARTACVRPAPVTTVSLGALDCMATGVSPKDKEGKLPPALPFYMPSVDAKTIDAVATSSLPISNRYTVYDAWSGNRPLVPITSWNVGTYTGLSFPGAPGDVQRGQRDVFGETAVQASGHSVGLWFNSQDTTSVLYAGSAAIATGCWYQTAPYARILPTAASELDVSFDAGVSSILSTGNAHGQAYFQLIAIDQSGACGKDCGFSLSVGFYSPYAEGATEKSVIVDVTETLSVLLAGAGLDSSGWIRRMPDSMNFKTSTFAPQRVHFRISTDGLIQVRNAIVAKNPSVYGGLSTNALDYAASLLVVSSEGYDPCKDPVHIRPCYGGDHAQLGISVHDLRVTSIVPHEAASVAAGIDAGGSRVVYRDAAGGLSVFAPVAGTSSSRRTAIPDTAGAVGDPDAWFSEGKTHVVFRDGENHVREAVADAAGTWVVRDVTAATRDAAMAYSDPKATVDARGTARVLYRDVTGDVHELVMDGDEWRDRNVTRLTAPIAEAAVGTPTSFEAGGTAYVVYRDGQGRVRLLGQASSGWSQRDLSALPDGATAVTEPTGFADADGSPHVVYRDINGAVHEAYTDGSGWHHRNITSETQSPPSLGSPQGSLVGCDSYVVYRGTDNHLHALTWSSGAWAHEDLTDVRGALPAVDDPTAFMTDDDVLHVVYRAGDGQLHELQRLATWLHRDF